MNIEFKENAVCYADGLQWFIWEEDKGTFICDKNTRIRGLSALVNDFDFQLNEPRQGDYLPKSELDTEQKYNDAVDEFGLFGCAWVESACEKYGAFRDGKILIWSDGLHQASDFHNGKKRKLTYSQLMAIGKLKRLMNEREIKQAVKSTINTEPDKPLTISANKYEREISGRQGNSATVDVYDVLKAFEVTCPATQHAVKKLLCSGIRGHKDLPTDLIEAKESIVRAIELNEF